MSPGQDAEKQAEEAGLPGWDQTVCGMQDGLGPQPLGSWESMMNDAWVCLQRNTANRNAGNRMRRLLRAPCKQRSKLGLRYLRWKVGWCEDIPELESVGCGEGSDRRKDGGGAKRTPKSLRWTPWGWGMMVSEARRLGEETAWKEGEGKDSAHSSDTQWAPDMLKPGACGRPAGGVKRVPALRTEEQAGARGGSCWSLEWSHQQGRPQRGPGKEERLGKQE